MPSLLCTMGECRPSRFADLAMKIFDRLLVVGAWAALAAPSPAQVSAPISGPSPLRPGFRPCALPSFVPGTTTIPATGPTALASADFDGDGEMDLASSNLSGFVGVFLNQGQHAFAAPITYPVAPQAFGIVAEDLNGDSHVDLVTTSASTFTVSVLLNTGLGSFHPATSYGVEFGASGIDAADLDGDGDLDLAVANHFSDTVSVLINGGSGTFAASVSYATGSAPFELRLCDVDGDLDEDLCVGNYGNGSLSVLMNTGSATFGPQVVYPLAGGFLSLTSGDLDGDADRDLVTVGPTAPWCTVLLNQGIGAFSVQPLLPAPGSRKRVTSGDIDADGDLDLAIAVGAVVKIYAGRGDGTFTDVGTYALPGVTGADDQAIIASDLDGDGDDDLAVNAAQSNSISILWNACR